MNRTMTTVRRGQDYGPLVFGISRSGGHADQAAAGLGAPATGFGALPAVVHMGRVLFALFGAGVTNLGAERADLPGKGAAAGHERHGRVAQFGAVPVQFDTAGHHLNVLFLKTGLGAGVAGNGAVLTGVDAILVVLGC